MKRRNTMLALLAGLSLTGAAQATLIDRGSGLIYDTDLNVTWLADANYALTSGHDADGQMTWSQATSWAGNLNYGGYSDWRLPTTPTSCVNYNCTDSEMGHLFYSELGGTAGSPILDSSDPDLGLFTNIQTAWYWSGTEYAPNPSEAFAFNLWGGWQEFPSKEGTHSSLNAWAVRTGDVSAVPEPTTLMLFGLGMAGLRIVRWRK